MFNKKLLAVTTAVVFCTISAVFIKAAIEPAEAAPPIVLGWPCTDPGPNEKFWEVYHESTYRMKVQGGWLYTVWLPDVFDKPPTLTFVSVPCRSLPRPL